MYNKIYLSIEEYLGLQHYFEVSWDGQYIIYI